MDIKQQLEHLLVSYNKQKDIANAKLNKLNIGKQDCEVLIKYIERSQKESKKMLIQSIFYGVMGGVLIGASFAMPYLALTIPTFVIGVTQGLLCGIGVSFNCFDRKNLKMAKSQANDMLGKIENAVNFLQSQNKYFQNKIDSVEQAIASNLTDLQLADLLSKIQDNKECSAEMVSVAQAEEFSKEINLTLQLNKKALKAYGIEFNNQRDDTEDIFDLN